MASLISKVGKWVKGEAVAIGRLFQKLFGKQAAADFAKAAIQVLKSDLGKIALTVCESLVSLEVSGDQKRAKAFSQIVTQAKAAGIEAKDSLINLLIELAVAAIKGHYAPK